MTLRYRESPLSVYAEDRERKKKEERRRKKKEIGQLYTSRINMSIVAGTSPQESERHARGFVYPRLGSRPE
jgi:hypothetical protein